MNDPQMLDRQRRIAPPEVQAGEGEPRSHDVARTSVWTMGIVRDVVGDEVSWQRMRYKRELSAPRVPPVVGQYEAYGPAEKGYPLETKKGTDYADLKVTGEPTAQSPIVRACWRHGFWILEPFVAQALKKVVILGPTAGSTGEFLNVRSVKRLSSTTPWIADTDSDPFVVETWYNETAADYEPFIGLNPPLIAVITQIEGSTRLLPNGAMIPWLLARPTASYSQSDCPQGTV